MIKRLLRASLRRLKHWLNEEEHTPEPAHLLRFENSYSWLGKTFQVLMQDQVCERRPPYAWGALQGVALAKALGLPRASLVEFGVAGGAGLLAFERVASFIEEHLDIGIEVYGFDTGIGLPKPKDYRDCPYLFTEGHYPMNVEQLAQRLRRARLTLGLVEATVPDFLQTMFAPVAFISFDLDLYSSTREALRLLDADHDRLLPRVFCYFDDIAGWPVGDYTGERLAIAEFNASHHMRKLSPLYGHKYFVPQPYGGAMWTEQFYFAELFDHDLYGVPDNTNRATLLDIEGHRKRPGSS